MAEPLFFWAQQWLWNPLLLPRAQRMFVLYYSHHPQLGRWPESFFSNEPLPIKCKLNYPHYCIQGVCKSYSFFLWLYDVWAFNNSHFLQVTTKFDVIQLSGVNLDRYRYEMKKKWRIILPFLRTPILRHGNLSGAPVHVWSSKPIRTSENNDNFGPTLLPFVMLLLLVQVVRI